LTDRLARWRHVLHRHLFHDVMPFWLRHALDDAGGLNTCINDDGELVSRDKWLWSQWRAVWVFGKLYEDFGRETRWLDAARHVHDFAARHGWDDAARAWRLCVDAEGRCIRGCESIYVDGFAIYGLTQYARVTGSDAAVTLARRTADAVIPRLQTPHESLATFPYPVPAGMSAHGLPMIFCLVLWELGQLLDDATYRDAALSLARDVMTRFARADRGLVLERVAVDGGEAPPPLGTAVVPGHVLESMWFQIHIARDRGDEATIQRACELIRRHLEVGWDAAHGGLLLAVDADGASDVGWNYADTKLWWPQVEGMYAALLAYEHTRAAWALAWFERLWDYCFAHYPVAGHGEWTQRLDRRGRPIRDVVALPVKDPFHLPRALIYMIQTLDRLTGSS